MTKMKPARTKDALTIELPKELKAWLETHCEERGHTVTWTLTRLIEQYREAAEK